MIKKPKDQTPEQRLASVRQEIKNLKAMARRPFQSAEKLELLINLRRSAQAEEKLIQKHLEWVANGRPMFHKLGYHDHTPEQYHAVLALRAAEGNQHPNRKATEAFSTEAAS
jgi:hypothetical protein